MSNERTIRFTRDHNGYAPGDVATVDVGTADAYVEYACAAEYVDAPKPEPKEEKFTAKRRDKMMKSEAVERKGE
jgi:hypothetical protein